MINTGLLLRKPGESSYAKYRRFLISNHGVCSAPQSIRKPLLKSFGLEKNISRRMAPLSINLASKLEEQFIKKYSLAPSTRLVDFRRKKPKKNCPKCAEIGYHSDIFDMPWINSCPVHNTHLLPFCNKCSQEWPSLSAIFSRKCNGCGIKINVSELIKKHAFVDNRFEKIRFIHQFLNQNCTNNEKLYSFVEHGVYGAQRNTNQPSIFNPTVIAIKKNVSDSDVNKLKQFGIPFYEPLITSFPINQFNPKKSPALGYKDLRRIYDAILKQSYFALSIISDPNHVVGECKHSQINSGDSCSICNTWSLWSQMVSFETSNNEYKLPGYLYYRLECRYKEIHQTRYDLRLPKPITHIQIVEKKATRSASLTLEAQQLIYTTDLWTTFLHIYHSFSHWERKTKEGAGTYLDILSTRQAVARPENKLFCPYYVYEAEESITIIIPENILKPEIAFTEDIAIYAE